ncbi:histidine kinase [Streptomyces viridochromogenes]|uniref:Histidine kinase n=1 Tax=Streptomyces viridochromogenes TaxID=1938 RepID=A0A0J7YVZ3_STRVR|nr:ATP-binding protein [Streptomyces viridochromogenes]KMS67627.1 histidine kinase [Streptomyces viridochromogenes]KOG15284.1 histidine kinase [Streptomyces viridochromogenes]KOG24551.1 histidine kinase [Streptomyces viridochromogenes]
MLRRNAFRLPRHPASVGLARRRVRDHLTDWGHGPRDPALEDAVLLVSELATNVVRHGPLLEREFEVGVTALADGSCLIEVSDEGRLEPRSRVVGEWEETGRGLHLVENVAAAWGVWGRGRHGKTVWALILADANP